MEEFERQRNECLVLCQRIVADLHGFMFDSDRFFGGEIRKAYLEATEQAIDKAYAIRSKLRSL